MGGSGAASVYRARELDNPVTRIIVAANRVVARELGSTGDLNDTAPMNIWLHKQVMRKLAENGGKVPADLLD